MKRMSFELEIAKVTVLLLILVVLFFQKRASKAPSEIVYRYKLIEAAVHSSGNSAIVMTDQENKIVFWNDGAEKLFGYREAEMMGKDLRIVSIVLPEVILKNTPVDTEGMHRLESAVPISLTASECKVGQTTHYIAFMKNIRERKERESIIAKELQLLNEGEEIGGFGSWSWAVNAQEMETDRVMVTDGFNRLFETDDFITDVQFLMKRVWHEDQARVFTVLKKAQEEKSDYEVDYRIQRLNGKIIWIRCIGKIFLTANGNIEKIVGTIQKIKKDA